MSSFLLNSITIIPTRSLFFPRGHTSSSSPSLNTFLLRQKAATRSSTRSCLRVRSSMVAGLGSKEDEEGKMMMKKKVTTWVDEYLPSEARPYALLGRFDKPIGTWLLALPAFWSIALAANKGELADLKTMGLCFFASMLLRSIACTINDYIDRDIDAQVNEVMDLDEIHPFPTLQPLKQVERSKTRPLASGALKPYQGLLFLGIQMLLVLSMFPSLDICSRILGATYLILVFTYPLMKRVTYWPQAYLGFAFNLGALSGWSLVKKGLDLSILLPLYAGGIFWTLVYDTIYAHQDKKDDAKVGVKSTALKLGDSTKQWITVFAIACLGCIAISGFNANLGWPFYAFFVAGCGQLAWQIWTVDLSSPPDCAKKFKSNQWFGAIVLIGIMFGRLIP